MVQWQKAECLGRGAFAKVYLGFNLENGEFLAAKEIQLQGSDVEIEYTSKAFQEEIELLKRLKHPNIVSYIDCERREDTLVIFIEYVPGGSVATVVKKFGALNERIVSVYARQILEGLEYLHKNRVIHRDIKGANVLVDTKGMIKLTDFGCSKQLEEMQNTSGGAKSMRGTPLWMAPEVIREDGYGRKADIWSVGCTILEMATGKPPWPSFNNHAAALYHIATQEEATPPIPDTLTDLIRDFLEQCFQRDPKKRPSARALLKHPFITQFTSGGSGLSSHGTSTSGASATMLNGGTFLSAENLAKLGTPRSSSNHHASTSSETATETDSDTDTDDEARSQVTSEVEVASYLSKKAAQELKKSLESSQEIQELIAYARRKDGAGSKAPSLGSESTVDPDEALANLKWTFESAASSVVDGGELASEVEVEIDEQLTRDLADLTVLPQSPAMPVSTAPTVSTGGSSTVDEVEGMDDVVMVGEESTANIEDMPEDVFNTMLEKDRSNYERISPKKDKPALKAPFEENRAPRIPAPTAKASAKAVPAKKSKMPAKKKKKAAAPAPLNERQPYSSAMDSLTTAASIYGDGSTSLGAGAGAGAGPGAGSGRTASPAKKATVGKGGNVSARGGGGRAAKNTRSSDSSTSPDRFRSVSRERGMSARERSRERAGLGMSENNRGRKTSQERSTTDPQMARAVLRSGSTGRARARGGRAESGSDSSVSPRVERENGAGGAAGEEEAMGIALPPTIEEEHESISSQGTKSLKESMKALAASEAERDDAGVGDGTPRMLAHHTPRRVPTPPHGETPRRRSPRLRKVSSDMSLTQYMKEVSTPNVLVQSATQPVTPEEDESALVGVSSERAIGDELMARLVPAAQGHGKDLSFNYRKSKKQVDKSRPSEGAQANASSRADPGLVKKKSKGSFDRPPLSQSPDLSEARADAGTPSLFEDECARKIQRVFRQSLDKTGSSEGSTMRQVPDAGDESDWGSMRVRTPLLTKLPSIGTSVHAAHTSSVRASVSEEPAIDEQAVEEAELSVMVRAAMKSLSRKQPRRMNLETMAEKVYQMAKDARAVITGNISGHKSYPTQVNKEAIIRHLAAGRIQRVGRRMIRRRRAVASPSSPKMTVWSVGGKVGVIAGERAEMCAVKIQKVYRGCIEREKLSREGLLPPSGRKVRGFLPLIQRSNLPLTNPSPRLPPIGSNDDIDDETLAILEARRRSSAQSSRSNLFSASTNRTGSSHSRLPNSAGSPQTPNHLWRFNRRSEEEDDGVSVISLSPMRPNSHGGRSISTGRSDTEDSHHVVSTPGGGSQVMVSTPGGGYMARGRALLQRFLGEETFMRSPMKLPLGRPPTLEEESDNMSSARRSSVPHLQLTARSELESQPSDRSNREGDEPGPKSGRSVSALASTKNRAGSLPKLLNIGSGNLPEPPRSAGGQPSARGKPSPLVLPAEHGIEDITTPTPVDEPPPEFRAITLMKIPSLACAEFVCGESLLAVGCVDGALILRDVSGARVAENEDEHAGSVNVIVAVDNERFVTGCSDGTVRLWAVENGRLRLDKRLEGFKGEVTCVAVYANICAAAGNRDIQVKLWDLREKKKTQNLYCGDVITALKVFESRLLVAYGTQAKVVDLKSWASAVRTTINISDNHRPKVANVAMNRVAIVTTNKDGLVKTWSPKTGDFKKSHRFMRKGDRMTAVDIVDDHIICGYSSGYVRVWNTAGKPMQALDQGDVQLNGIRQLHGKRVVLYYLDGSMKVWSKNVATWELDRDLVQHNSSVDGVQACELGHTFLSHSRDGELCVWSDENPFHT